jgi:hypothetical protein
MNGLDVFRLLLFLVVTLFCSQTQAQNNYGGRYTGTGPWSSSTVGPGNPPPQVGSNPVTLSIDDSGKLIDFYEGSIPLRVRQQSNFTGGQVDANGVLKFGYTRRLSDQNSTWSYQFQLNGFHATGISVYTNTIIVNNGSGGVIIMKLR